MPAYQQPGDGGGMAFANVTEAALALLEGLPGPAWARLAELTRVHLAGLLSYESWRASCGSILEHLGRQAREDGSL